MYAGGTSPGTPCQRGTPLDSPVLEVGRRGLSPLAAATY